MCRNAGSANTARTPRPISARRSGFPKATASCPTERAASAVAESPCTTSWAAAPSASTPSSPTSLFARSLIRLPWTRFAFLAVASPLVTERS
uniref:Uncharacterized protein n=1 Tax=Steinernema glaseri TaxID=37863 RepID=A0A1I7ZHR7_9BILA